MAELKKDFEDAEVKHDIEKIDRKAADVKEHEAQIEKDRTKLMKDLHEEEIKHDQKVIAKEEEKLAKKGVDLGPDAVVEVTEEVVEEN